MTLVHRPPSRPLAPPIDWAPATGRELGSEVLPDAPLPQWRIVACLNVWNDHAALKRTLRTWIDHVDAVIAVDGEYGPIVSGDGLSTDGTRDYLAWFPKITLLDAPGVSQCEKRTLYCAQHAEPTEQDRTLLVIVDADETIENANELRRMPILDVGWVRITSALYTKPYGQPRLIRWQTGLHYAGRHHWLYRGDDLLATHQYGGVGFEHRTVPIGITNHRGLGHSVDRKAQKRSHMRAQGETERETSVAERSAGPHTAKSDALMRRRESLRIAMLALRDDGLAPSRLHAAINRTTPHASLFWSAQPHPYGAEQQYQLPRDRQAAAHAMRDADVVHIHVNVPDGIVIPRGKRVVLHHHGSPLRRHPDAFAALAAAHSALVFVSNLQLLTYAPGAIFLPNVMPVARYRRLRAMHATSHDTFRVAHSPSRPAIKGTEAFLACCARIAAKGYPIEPVLIQNVSHRESLAMKATCDAAFDAFWLGLQCSGLEAAAMGLPVIAGDHSVADRCRALYGDAPYTFADTEEELELALQRLMDDSEFRLIEADRVSQHVLEYHDESAVGLAYLDALDDAFQWRSNVVTP